MTVEATIPIQRYKYNGPGTYTFSFNVLKTSDVIVQYIDTEGVPNDLSPGYDYDITIVEGQSGGNVEMYLTGTTGSIEIRRYMERVQSTDYVNNSALDLNIIESDFDKVVMMVQEVTAIVDEGVNSTHTKGEWKPDYDYRIGDAVDVDQSIYQCIIAHRSQSDFQDDLNNGYWVILFDITYIRDYTDRAENAATDAINAKNIAVTSAINAQNSEDNALISANDSIDSANDAEASATSAHQSRNDAETFRNEALRYAIGTPTEPTEGSSKYWANQAMTSCTGSVENMLINGNFDIWQRGESQGQNYFGIKSADRWKFGGHNGGGTNSYTFERIHMNDTSQITPPTAIDSILRVTYDNRNGGDYSRVLMSQKMIDLRRFNHKRVYITFWAISTDGGARPMSISFKYWYYDDEDDYPYNTTQTITIENYWKEYTIAVDLPSISQACYEPYSGCEVIFWFSAGPGYNDIVGKEFGRMYLSGFRLYTSDIPRNCRIRSKQEERNLCHEYFWQTYPFQRFIATSFSAGYVSTEYIFHPKTMVRRPAVELVGNLNTYGNFSRPLKKYDIYGGNKSTQLIFAYDGGAGAVGQTGVIQYDSIKFDAEI